MDETENDNKEKKKKGSGWSLNPLDWLREITGGIGSLFDGIGSLFSFIIPALIFAPILYAVAQSETVQGWIGGFLDDDPVKGKAKVKGFMDKINAGLESFLSPMGITLFDGATESLLENADAETARELLVDHSDGQITAEMAQIIAPDTATWKSNLALFKKCGGDFKKPESFKSLAFREALFNANPKLALALAAAAARNPATAVAAATSTPAGTDATATTAPASNSGLSPSLALSLTSGGALDQMLGTAGNDAATRRSNMQNLIDLTAAQTGIAVKPDAGKLLALLDAVGMKDGKTTQTFRDYLAAALTPDANGQPAAMAATLRFMATPAMQTPAAAKALAELAQSIDLNTVTVENQKLMVQLLRSNAPQTIKLLSDLGPEKTTQLMSLMQATNKAPVIRMALQEPALRTFLDTIDVASLPADKQKMILELRKTPEDVRVEAARIAARNVDPIKLRNAFFETDKKDAQTSGAQPKEIFSIDKTLENILKPDGRATLRLAGTDALAKMATLTGASSVLSAGNLNAMLAFGDAVDATSRTLAQDARDRKVLKALLQNMQGEKTPFKALAIDAKTGEIDAKGISELSSFFRDHKQAFGTLLKQLDMRAMQPAEQRFFIALRDHWDKPGDSIGAVLASPAGIRLIFENLEPPTIQASDWLKEAYLGIVKGRHLSASFSPVQTNEIAQNLPAIMAVMQVAGVSMGGKAAPQPSPSRPGAPALPATQR